MARIVIVDYDMGNLASVCNGFRAVGYEVLISPEPAVIRSADGIVLPGMGAFGSGMQRLAQRQLDIAVREFVAGGRPALGICLGMQLFCQEGEEYGAGPGLGLLSGRVTRLPERVKLPQIGWNLVEMERPGHPIFAGIEGAFWAYFDHSYAADGVQPDEILATTDYGRRYPSVVGRGSLIGIQFHPEKSSRIGLQMLSNFGGLVCDSISTRRST